MAITTLSQVKLILGVTNNTKDTLITALIPMIEEHYQLIQCKLFDEDELGDTVYPLGSELIAIQMIKQQLDFSSRSGKSSESLGDYSVSFFNQDEYDKQITGRIKKYVRLK